MGADVNVRTFEHTMRLCEQNTLLKKKVEASIASTRIIRNSEKLDVPDKNRYEDEANVLVSPFSTIEAAFDYTGANHIAVLKYDGNDPTLMPEEDWYEIDVISCIPPDTSSRAGNRDYYVNPKDLHAFKYIEFAICDEHHHGVLQAFEDAFKTAGLPL